MANDSSDARKRLAEMLADIDPMWDGAPLLVLSLQRKATIGDLRALLAEASAPAGEPVAWMIRDPEGISATPDRAIAERQQDRYGYSIQPLYAAPVVPAGWKLVPVEPTRDMEIAALECARDREILELKTALGAGDFHPWKAALEGTIEKMSQDIEELRMDAERYRWLRESMKSEVRHIGFACIRWSFTTSDLQSKSLDQCVDAACSAPLSRQEERG